MTTPRQFSTFKFPSHEHASDHSKCLSLCLRDRHPHADPGQCHPSTQQRPIMQALRPWPWKISEAVKDLNTAIDRAVNVYKTNHIRPQNRIRSLQAKSNELQRTLDHLRTLLDAECRAIGQSEKREDPSPDQQAHLHPRPEPIRTGLSTPRASSPRGITYHWNLYNH